MLTEASCDNKMRKLDNWASYSDAILVLYESYFIVQKCCVFIKIPFTFILTVVKKYTKRKI